MNARVEVFEGRDGQWYVHIRHVNGNLLFDTEGYTRKSSARRAGRRTARIFRLEYRELSSPPAP